jgi:hypothetical protein
VAKGTLPRGAVARIHKAVDTVFDRILTRFLERPQGDKRIYIGAKPPRTTLPEIFRAASASERVKTDETILSGLMEVAKSFLDAQRERTKAHTVKAVQGWLHEAHAAGVDTDLSTVLEGELARVFGKAHDGVKRILDTEATTARNMGTLDGIVKVNAASGIEDPVVYFVVVRDIDLCSECLRLHMLDDEKTPRVWYLSELGHGYHTKGDDRPKVSGLHPHCRCSLVTLMPGYGFDDAGMVDWIGLDHDEMKKQRGASKKNEQYWGEALRKSDPDVFYHGTPHQFERFESKPGYNTATMGLAAGAEPVQRHGFFFTQNQNFANSFAGPSGRIITAHLNLGNQLDLSGPYHTQVKHFNNLAPHFAAQGLDPEHGLHHLSGSSKHKRMWQLFDGEEGRKAVAAITGAGYHSVKFGEEDDDGQPVTTHVVFDPSQIQQR